jgi:hypothetical protein
VVVAPISWRRQPPHVRSRGCARARQQRCSLAQAGRTEPITHRDGPDTLYLGLPPHSRTVCPEASSLEISFGWQARTVRPISRRQYLRARGSRTASEMQVMGGICEHALHQAQRGGDCLSRPVSARCPRHATSGAHLDAAGVSPHLAQSKPSANWCPHHPPYNHPFPPSDPAMDAADPFASGRPNAEPRPYVRPRFWRTFLVHLGLDAVTMTSISRPGLPIAFRLCPSSARKPSNFACWCHFALYWIKTHLSVDSTFRVIPLLFFILFPMLIIRSLHISCSSN